MAGSRPTGWKSYDSVAEQYDRLTPPLFGLLARDLVELLDPDPSALVLDAGTGTGTAVEALAPRLGPEGSVVGVDPSLGMLARARLRLRSVVAGVIPNLPFPGAVFDAVVANLVLSHLADARAGTADLVRVLRAGGWLAVTAWPEDRETPDSDAKEASGIVDAALEETGLPVKLPEREKGAPAEEWLKDEDNLRALLSHAGLDEPACQVHTYRYELTPDDYVGWHAWAGRGRYLRSTSDEGALQGFERRARDALGERFPGGIRMVSHARLAVAGLPS